MDTLFFYRAIEAVAGSLAAAGREGFRLSPASGPNRWFSADWLFDYLKGVDHDSVPFLWEGRPMPAFDRLGVSLPGWSRPIKRLDRHDLVVIRGEVAVAVIYTVDRWGDDATIIVVGEKRPGALQEFLDGYCAYAKKRAREDPHVTVIGGDPVRRPEGIAWESLILPAAFRDEIRTQVEGFFASRELYARMGVQWRRGLLLAGPPGNGKTTLLRVIASQVREPMIVLAPGQRIDQSRLDEAFDRAICDAPAILCFEDVDSLFARDIPLSHFLNRLDGIETLEGVLILATTNHPEKLDQALTCRPSRFDRVWVFGNPEAAERRLYLSRQFGRAFDERLVAWTDGFSMAHLKEVWVSACLEAIGSGSEAPSIESARAAAHRLRGQKEAAEREFEDESPIGFGV